MEAALENQPNKIQRLGSLVTKRLESLKLFYNYDWKSTLMENMRYWRGDSANMLLYLAAVEKSVSISSHKQYSFNCMGILYLLLSPTNLLVNVLFYLALEITGNLPMEN